ncbi:VIT1/CCC1 transporter family protein [Amycolatopsis cihanbeyliensis]|uniref:VIT1/CCC1 family predicted Fe2+/Mn2+ transporter n=1 Tax=Amycolatopsis cihanbeyliensis TaxID=1128664 RepID=A0A542DMX7_AMYCI|nr:VIT family protein [Amycolatopsis cihanbeyliensis]TQJ04451.1 VIT1/CCC1 family predicted Fe2+/Mn2+ transporter [Amycolatopsis cihanbeyliensis]
MTDTPEPAHSDEAHHDDVGGKLNWLRAGVLGANDGIVSVAGLVVGVAGATADRMAILTAGIAGLVAGALSMAGGEYVSVSSQRDSERAMLRLERRELATMPEAEERELAEIYQHKGLSPELAARVAKELTAKDALQAHAEAELRIDPKHLTSPWQAAWASLLAFSIGALLPLVAITVPPTPARVWACAAAVVLSLALTGLVSAWLGGARIAHAITRNVGVGALTMAVTYLVGTLFGAAV